MFFQEIQKKMVELRDQIEGRYRVQSGQVRQVVDDYENQVREKIAGLIGVRAYREFEGDLDAGQRAKLLKQVKDDLGQALKEKLLIVGHNSLKERLINQVGRVREIVYKEETGRIAEIWASLLPEGTKVSPEIKEADLRALRGLPLAGLSIEDYIQKVLIELYFGSIQSVTNAFIDAKTFDGGIRAGLAQVSQKFETNRNRLMKLVKEIIVQASNQASSDIHRDMEIGR
jgi:type II secretory ATPase GspE/PulE/Tfp pilus assembly ATPase PilB-like protein